MLNWNELALAALESPVVIFLLLMVIVWVLRNPLASLLASRNVEIRWGQNHIKLNELSNSLDQELDPLKAEIESLEERLRLIEASRDVEAHPIAPNPNEEQDDHVRQAILAALANRKFRWRSVPGLVQAAKAPEEKVWEIVQNDDSIVVGYDKSGETLVKLKNR